MRKFFFILMTLILSCFSWSRGPAVEDLHLMDLEQLRNQPLESSKADILEFGQREQAKSSGFLALIVAFLFVALPLGIGQIILNQKPSSFEHNFELNENYESRFHRMQKSEDLLSQEEQDSQSENQSFPKAS